MEPLRTISEPETPRIEKSEKESDSTRKKKREKAARHLHAVKNEADSSKQIKPEKIQSNIVDIFEAKEARAKAATEVKAESKPESQVESSGDSESLDEMEVVATASTLAEAELETVPKYELGQEITPEVGGDIAVVDFLEDVANGVPIEDAAAAVHEKIGATPDEVSQVEAELPSQPPERPAEAEELDEIDSKSESEPAIESSKEETETDTPEGAEEEDEDPTVASTGAPHPHGAALSGTGAATTPMPPTSAPAPGGHGGPGGPARRGPPFGPGGLPGIPGWPGNPNLFPAPITSGNLNMPPSAEQYDSGNPVVMALLGYIIGRRHGRRKAERRAAKSMRQYERKVKHQIEDVDWQLKAKEQQIRKLAATKVEEYGPSRAEVQAKQQAARANQSLRRHEQPGQERSNAQQMQVPRSTRERQDVDRRPAPEASQLHGATKAHEHIGHVLVNAAEAPLSILAAKSEKPLPLGGRTPEIAHQKAPEQLPKHLTERHVETLNRSELLSLSEKIQVEGSTLRQIYETHLIGERGLRRLVAEHLRGGDVKKILRREIVEHEIDFERDPAVRDISTSLPVITRSASSTINKETLDKLVQQASAGLGASDPQTAYYKARAAYEAQEQLEEKNRRRLVDIGLVTTIVVLVTAVAILYLTRR